MKNHWIAFICVNETSVLTLLELAYVVWNLILKLNWVVGNVEGQEVED